MKYAHRETERRWRLSGLPDECVAVQPVSITDRYLHSTRMRLRRVDHADGSSMFKLGQKVPVSGSGPSDVWHTTMYLDDAEWAALSVLGGYELRKDRFALQGPLDLPGAECAQRRRIQFAVDRFHGGLDGLVLAETSESGEPGVICPQVSGLALEAILGDRVALLVQAEVTDDPRYCGAALAIGGRIPGEGAFHATHDQPVVLVIRSSDGQTKQIADAVVAGADHAVGELFGVANGPQGSDGETRPIVRACRPQDVLTRDVRTASAIVIVTHTNFGALPGVVKAMLDRGFREWSALRRSIPCTVYCRGESDPSGAVRQIGPILQGLRWRLLREPIESVGAVSGADLDEAFELGASTVAHALM